MGILITVKTVEKFVLQSVIGPCYLRGVRANVWYQCGNKWVKAQIKEGAYGMATMVRRDEMGV